MRLAEALRELVGALVHSSVDYALVGGLAASARGEARFTRDIDVSESTVASYLDLIEARGYARGQALRDKWSHLRDELGV